MMHIPVMLDQVLTVLQPKSGESILDVTVGLGGHASALLHATGKGGFLVGLDTDNNNLLRSASSLPSGQITLINGNFRFLQDLLPVDNKMFDIIIADLGVSSVHFDDPERGFSFRFDAPLDMRLNADDDIPAWMYLSSHDRTTLIKVFKEYGEVPRAHALVDEILSRRKSDPVRTTFDLVAASFAAYGEKRGRDLLPQIFQGLRIAVNRELDSLDVLLSQAPKHLKTGGRFCVITFHSLEDRKVKQTFRALTTPVLDPVTGGVHMDSEFELLTKRSIVPTEEEITKNPRARSAHLRAIRRRMTYTHPRS